MLQRASITTVPFEFKLTKALCFYSNSKAKQNLAVMFKHKDGKLINPEPYSGSQVKDLIPDNQRQLRYIYLTLCTIVQREWCGMSRARKESYECSTLATST